MVAYEEYDSRHQELVEVSVYQG
ncbi:uncharacterized protein METZ01_LOCUS51033 [marine metagenome]|uniref:Uncharacterized protein n=1 Tax=marine metagenome TaxID=408172 RepID=A0A381S414_9ZZZZ